MSHRLRDMSTGAALLLLSLAGPSSQAASLDQLPPELLPQVDSLAPAPRLPPPAPTATGPWPEITLGTLAVGAGTYALVRGLQVRSATAEMNAQTDQAAAQAIYTSEVVPGVWATRIAAGTAVALAGAGTWALVSRTSDRKASGQGSNADPGAQADTWTTPERRPRRAIGEGPISGEATVFGGASAWLPAPIVGTTSSTRGYASVGGRARLRLFDTVELVRLNYEQSVGRAPTSGSLTGSDLVDDTLGARILDGLLTVAIDDELSLGVFVRNEHFDQTLTLDEPKFVVDSDSTLAQLEGMERTPAGTQMRNAVTFTRVDAGYVLTSETDGIDGVGMAGLSYLTFKKPWSLAWLDPEDGAELVFDSRIQALGVGVSAVGRPVESGVIFGAEYFTGYGSIQLTDDLALEDVVAGYDVAVIAVLGGLEGGWRQVLVDRDGVQLAAEASASVYGDWFFLIERSDVEETSDGEAAVDAGTATENTLTWDLRGSALVRMVGVQIVLRQAATCRDGREAGVRVCKRMRVPVQRARSRRRFTVHSTKSVHCSLTSMQRSWTMA